MIKKINDHELKNVKFVTFGASSRIPTMGFAFPEMSTGSSFFIEAIQYYHLTF